MAATALLRSMARKLARAPPPPALARGLRDGARSGPGPQGLGSHRLLHERGLHSSTSPNPGASRSTPPPTSDKDLIEDLRTRLRAAGASGSAAFYLYFWKLPKVKAQAYSQAKKMIESKLYSDTIKKIDSMFEDMEKEIMQRSDAGQEVFPVTKITDLIKDIQADVKAIKAINIKDRQAAVAEGE